MKLTDTNIQEDGWICTFLQIRGYKKTKDSKDEIYEMHDMVQFIRTHKKNKTF
jgi:hypothetical protein